MDDKDKLIESKIKEYNNWFGNRRIPLKDTRILWGINKELKINHILVCEFDMNEVKDDSSHTRPKYPTAFPYYLYDYFGYDIGNCVFDAWKYDVFYQHILNLFHGYGFETFDLQRDFIEHELSKIEEFCNDLWKLK